MLIGPDQQRARQVCLARWQVHTLDGHARILPIWQHQVVTLHVHRTQGKYLGDACAGRPQHAQKQPVALTCGCNSAVVRLIRWDEVFLWCSRWRSKSAKRW